MKKLNPIFVTPVLFVVLGIIGRMIQFNVLALYSYSLTGWVYIILLGIFVGWVYKRFYNGSNRLPLIIGLVGIVAYIAWMFTQGGRSFQDGLEFMLGVIGLGYLPVPMNLYIHIEYALAFLLFFLVAKILQKIFLLSAKSNN